MGVLYDGGIGAAAEDTVDIEQMSSKYFLNSLDAADKDKLQAIM